MNNMGITEDLNEWAAVIADVVYSAEREGSPTYLDIEDDHWAKICELQDSDRESAEKSLISCVKKGLTLNKTNLFELFLIKTAAWERTEATTGGPPPALPLLAVLSLAAENMAGDSEFGANNYYGRVSELIDIEPERFRRSYTKMRGRVVTANRLWGSLNEWLERWDGLRGTPTAFAVSYKYVGLPRSQALIRAHDRQVLGRMFESSGFAPYTSLSPSDMERFIEVWIRKEPCPAISLRSLWDKDKKTIAELACAELEAWDGPDDEGSGEIGHSITSDIRLMMSMHVFPQEKVELSLVMGKAAAGQEQGEETFTVEGSNSDDPLAFTQSVNGQLRLADAKAVDFTTILNGLVHLSSMDGEKKFKRIPRRLVPLRKDESLQLFVESERLGLAEDSVLLCKSDIANAVNTELIKVAQPGYLWKKGQDTNGLPDSWDLFSSVRLLTGGVDTKIRELQALVPFATSTVVVDGGFRLPGGTRKWSLLMQPQVRAASVSGGDLELHITCSRVLDPLVEKPEPMVITGTDPVVVVSLEDHSLAEGEYRIELREAGKRKPLQAALVRLRSAGFPSVLLKERFALGFESGFEVGPIPCPNEEKWKVRGARVLVAGVNTEGNGGLETVTPAWLGNDAASASPSEQEPRVIGDIDFADCIRSNQHHWIEDALVGEHTGIFDCKFCNITNRFPVTHQAAKARTKSSSKTVAPVFNVANVETIPPTPEARRQFTVALDALSHGLQGNAANLEKVAAQIDASALAYSNFWRSLSSLGHIEVERDSRTLRPIAWEISPSTLVGLGGGQYVFAGFRSQKLLAALEEAVSEQGGEMSCTPQPVSEGPDLVQVKHLDESGAQVVEKVVAQRTSLDFRVQPDAALNMAYALPALSTLIAGLKRIPLVSGTKVETWCPETTKYSSEAALGRPGFYRIHSHSSMYVIRDEKDINKTTMKVVDVYLMKHAAALAKGAPLVGYDNQAQVLYVPQGADLPGLYGRAAVLASGILPVFDGEKRVLKYQNVSSALAAAIYERISS